MTNVSVTSYLCASLSSIFFFFQSTGHHRDLHSFPTRRSSDLCARRPRQSPRGQGAVRDLKKTLEERARRRASRRDAESLDRKSTRLNSSHRCISYAVFCLKKKKKKKK